MFTVLSTMCVIGKDTLRTPTVAYRFISMGKTLLELSNCSWIADIFPGPIAFVMGLFIA